MRTKLQLILVGSALSLAGACSSSTPSNGDVNDAVSIDAGTDVFVIPDVPDTALPDVRPDTGPPDVDEGAALGEACDENAECASNRCVALAPGEGGSLCASVCIDDSTCPRDFDCVLVSSGGADTTSLCLPSDLCIDPDGDRHGIGPDCLGRDCDEENATVNGSASEVCDGNDNDCNGEVDEDPRDVGLDCNTGFGGACAEGRTVCASGALTCEQRNEATPEICDNADNDCDGLVDEGADGTALTRDCYDGDSALVGIGVCALGVQTCSDGGFSACFGQVLPTAETCDEADNDCDGETDEGLRINTFYADADVDTFGDQFGTPVEACAAPDGYVSNALDCDDGDETIRPGAGEIPGDEVDQNCDGTEFCFEDDDNDGYRSPSGAVLVSTNISCTDEGEAPVSDGLVDCNDRQPAAYPGNPEVCDRIDNDCNERIDEGAGCYPVGELCDGPEDCATALCEGGVCVAPITCIEDGSCPQRLLTTSGAGAGRSERFAVELSAPSGAASPVVNSERYRLHVGPTPHLTDP